MVEATIDTILQERNPRLYETLKLMGKYKEWEAIKTKEEYKKLENLKIGLGFITFSSGLDGEPRAKLSERGLRHYNTFFGPEKSFLDLLVEYIFKK